MDTDKGIDLPGPIDWESASHFLRYDEERLTVETWCRMGPEPKITIRTRVRPMVESEIIQVKLTGHSRDAVLKAYGVDEDEMRRLYDLYRSVINTPPKKWWMFWR